MRWPLLLVFAFGPGLAPSRAEAVTLLNQGIKLVEKKEWEDALRSVEQATLTDPTLAEAHLALGQIHREQGRYDEAIGALEIGLAAAGEQDGVRGKLSYQLGAAQFLEANLETTSQSDRRSLLTKAIEAFGTAIKFNPQDHLAYHRRARAYDRLDQPSKADNDYRSCILHQTRYIKCFVGLGMMYIDYGFDDAGLAVLETGAQANETSAKMWAALGRARSKLDRHADAVEAFDKAKAIDPDNPMIRFSLGMAHAELHHREEGVEELEAFLDKASPETPRDYTSAAHWTIKRLRDAI